MTLRVRALGDDEADELARMARSRTLGAGLVRRAQIVRHAVEEGLSAPEIAARMGLCDATVRFWLKRFNERGLPGLEEDMRSGRPPTYTAEERSAVVKAALSRPAELGLPFAAWTLDRLVAYLGERGIGMRRRRGGEGLPGGGGGRRPGEKGAESQQELSWAATGQAGRAASGAGQAGDRLRPARRRGLRVRRPAAGHRRRVHRDLRAP